MKAGEVKNVMVVGAGVMGHSIAQVFAQTGVEAYLVDVKREALETAMANIRSNLDTLIHAGRLPANDKETIIGRIHMVTGIGEAAGNVDFAIEAVVEVPEVKKSVFAELERLCPEDLVLASNTSSLDVFSIADLKRPERLVVAHWFAPGHIIPLVEVVPGPQTDPNVVAFTAALMQRIGKRTLEMKKFNKAFVVNLIQQGIYRMVWQLLEKELATPEEIDLAVKLTLGVRLPIVGVMQSADFSGLDLAYDIQKGKGEIVPIVEEKFKQGHFGVKTGRGFYDYGGRSETEILEKRDRLYLKMLHYMEEIEAFEPV